MTERSRKEKRVFQVWDGEGDSRTFKVDSLEEGFLEILGYLRESREVNEELLEFLKNQIENRQIIEFLDALCQMEVSFRVLLKKSLDRDLEHPPTPPRIIKL